MAAYGERARAGRRRGAWVVAVAGVAILGPSPRAADTAWQVSDGDVRVVCPLTVGGSFEARTTALSGTLTPDAAAPAGSLAVDLRTLDTGIALRNAHLRDRYLEVQRGEGFDRAVLSNVRLARPEALTAGGSTPFTADLLVHGVTRRVEGEARFARQGAAVRVDARFPLSLAEFDIPSPRYLGIGVRDRVTVRVTFVATPAA